MQLGAKYVLSPCCYGQTSGFYARSQVVSDLLTPDEFNAVASAADFTANAEDTGFVDLPQFHAAKTCMQVCVLADGCALNCECSFIIICSCCRVFPVAEDC